MSWNESIYSGTSAHSARQIAEELQTREWPLADDNLRSLAGAVTTLARTVEQQQHELAKLGAGLTAVAREVGRITPVVVDHDAGHDSLVERYADNAAHIVGDPSVRLATPDAQLDLVYLGLAEVYRMAAQRERYERESREGAYFGALVAIEARCRAMLEAAGKLPPD